MWYEIVHPVLLRRRTDMISQPWISYDDVVVDDYAEVLWRLRALHGLKKYDWREDCFYREARRMGSRE